MKITWRKIKTYINENFAAEQEQLTAWVPFCFAAGIALYFALPTEPNIWFSLGIFELWLLLFYLLRRKNLHLLFLSGLVFCLGFMNIQAHTLYQSRRIENISEKSVTYLRGQIKNISRSEKGKIRLLLYNTADFDRQLKGDFRITIMPAPQNIQIGQCVEMIATIFPREPLPILGGYQLDRKYFYENLSAIGYSNSETFIIDCPQNTTHNKFITALNTLRQQITQYISTILTPVQCGIADAILIGERTNISKQILNNFRDSGLAHFLSVSGLHLGAIAGLVFFMVRFLLALFPAIALRFDIKKIAAIVAVLFSAFYLLISGMAIPAQRAFIMTTVVLIGVVFNRQAISLRMVSFAALMILIISPQALISIGFQMSFAAVYALVSFYESYKRRPYQKRGIFSTIWLYLSGVVICDFVASLATAPFALYHFHRLALYTSLGNLLAGPLIGLYLLPVMLMCLTALPLHLAFYPLKLLGVGLNLLNQITDWVAHLPHSVWQTDALPFWGFMLIVLGGFWLCVWKRNWRWWGLVPIIIGIVPLFMAQPQPDMVFSPYAADIAVRDNANDLILLPRQNDSWIKSLWQENLQLKPLSRREQNNFIVDDLQCTDEHCIYKDAVTFDAGGNITLNGEPIDNTAGGYIYLGKNPHWQPLWNNKKHRAWNKSKDKQSAE
ncbi:MAG: ComEC/Rec2 family competence protein [Alphaproteobacteria bacterium]|nr:ComEC/Rec2 family competence protein [Alphaproteobacteria bacterium]